MNIHPNLIGVGSARAGSTALYNNLKCHPEVFMPSKAKELLYFAFYGKKTNYEGPGDKYRFIQNFDEYLNFFAGSEKYKIRGEISPLYLYHPKAAYNIKKSLPETKIIISLRNPVDRAFSHFLKNYEIGVEPIHSFSAAISQEKLRKKENWGPRYHYLSWGFYYQQVKRYLEIFDMSKVFIYLYEDYNKGPEKILQNIYRFLEIEDSFIPDTSYKFWASPKKIQIPKNGYFNSLINNNSSLKFFFRQLMSKKARANFKNYLNHFNMKEIRAEIDDSFRAELINKYKADILKLEQLINMDLSNWLK